jgi:hypothetical protein
MFNTNAAILYWLSQQRQWPPKFPRTQTLLTPHEDPKTPRDEWAAAEWQAYAMFLEQSGKNIMRELTRFEANLQVARRKLSRPKPSFRTVQQVTLLVSQDDWNKKARGRKPTGKRESIAAEIISIRTELEASGHRITDRVALGEWFARNGMRRSRVTENRNILNAVSQYRSRHKISKW